MLLTINITAAGLQKLSVNHNASTLQAHGSKWSVRSAVVNNHLDSSWSFYTGPLTMTHQVLEEKPLMAQTGWHKTAETT